MLDRFAGVRLWTTLSYLYGTKTQIFREFLLTFSVVSINYILLRRITAVTITLSVRDYVLMDNYFPSLLVVHHFACLALDIVLAGNQHIGAFPVAPNRA